MPNGGRPKVFIANRGSHDYRPAEKFGDLVFVTDGEINKFAIGELFRRAQEVMKHSTEEDFFLPTSLPILSGICSALLAYKHGRVRYLLFKYSHGKKAGEYIERTIYLGDQ
jgi:hypothetical protein